MRADDFRRLALAMPDASEGAHMQHPDFRANGRIFATLHPDGVTGMVKLSPMQQQALVRAHAREFAPSSGAWGRHGCTDVRLQQVDAEVLTAAMTDAWQLAMSMPAAKPRRAAGTQAKATKTKATSRAKPQSRTKAGATSAPAAKSKAAKSEPTARRGAKTKTKPMTGAKAETKTNARANPETNARAKPEPKTKTRAKAKRRAASEPEPARSPEPGPEQQPAARTKPRRTRR